MLNTVPRYTVPKAPLPMTRDLQSFTLLLDLRLTWRY
jgi:hypothetical protein